MHTSIKEQIPENSVMYTNIQVSKIQRYVYIIYFKCLNSGYCDWKPHAGLWPTHQLSPTISAVSPLYDTLFMSKHSRRACEHLKMNWQNLWWNVYMYFGLLILKCISTVKLTCQLKASTPSSLLMLFFCE